MIISGPDLTLHSLEMFDCDFLTLIQKTPYLKVLHEFSRGVINARWADYQQKKTELGDNFETEYFGEAKAERKRRLSFLGMTFNCLLESNHFVQIHFCRRWTRAKLIWTDVVKKWTR